MKKEKLSNEKVFVGEMEKRFGITAVEKRFITAEELIDALKIQVTEDIERGQHRLLGRILLDQGQITVQEIDDVLESMEKLKL